MKNTSEFDNRSWNLPQEVGKVEIVYERSQTVIKDEDEGFIVPALRFLIGLFTKEKKL